MRLDKYLNEGMDDLPKLKDVTVEMIIQVDSSIKNKSFLITALKNVLSQKTGMSLKAVKKVSGI